MFFKINRLYIIAKAEETDIGLKSSTLSILPFFGIEVTREMLKLSGQYPLLTMQLNVLHNILITS
jgi:hypothetical protein